MSRGDGQPGHFFVCVSSSSSSLSSVVIEGCGADRMCGGIDTAVLGVYRGYPRHSNTVSERNKQAIVMIFAFTSKSKAIPHAKCNSSRSI